MNNTLTITALIAVSTLIGVIIATASPEPPHDVVAVETIQNPPAEYEALASELNQTREQHNRKALAYNAKLQTSACYKADEILSNDNFNHDNADGTKTWVHFDKAGYTGTALGENLAKGYSSDTAMIQAWLDSPSHRANLLSSDYTEQGVCKKSGTLNGKDATITVAHYGARQ